MTIYWNERKAMHIKKIIYQDQYIVKGVADLEAKVPDGDMILHFSGGTNIPVEYKTKYNKTYLKNDRKWTNVMNRGNNKSKKGFANKRDKQLPLSSVKNR